MLNGSIFLTLEKLDDPGPAEAPPRWLHFAGLVAEAGAKSVGADFARDHALKCLHARWQRREHALLFRALVPDGRAAVALCGGEDCVLRSLHAGGYSPEFGAWFRRREIGQI